MAVRARVQAQRAAVRTILMCVWAAASVAVAVAPAIGYGGTAFADDGVPPPLPYGGTTCVGPSPTRFPGVPWPVARMAPQRVWPLSRGEGETVAIVDSGVSRAAVGLARGGAAGLDVVSGGAADLTAWVGDRARRDRRRAASDRHRRGGNGAGRVGATHPDHRPSARVPPDALARGITAARIGGRRHHHGGNRNDRR